MLFTQLSALSEGVNPTRTYRNRGWGSTPFTPISQYDPIRVQPVQKLAQSDSGQSNISSAYSTTFNVAGAAPRLGANLVAHY